MDPMTDMTESDWSELARHLDSKLIAVEPPLQACRIDPRSQACVDDLKRLANPFAIEDDPAAFHTTGWFNAFTSQPSRRVVVPESAAEVAEAVRLCAERDIPLVVKGTGHDYLGRSSDPDALMIWTHHLRDVTVHDDFSLTGAPPGEPGVPAISVGAGVRWLEAYQALPSDRYVQGGGCTSVGVSGFTLGGGFGSFSRRFGTAAGNLLEAEVVTASGQVVVANTISHPELFWALRGGGFGLGVITRLTMRTHEPPPTLGAVAGTVRASNPDAYRALIRRLVDVFPALCSASWGEQIRFREDDSIELALMTTAIGRDEANAVWESFLSWVDSHPDEYESNAFVAVTSFESFWRAERWDAFMPERIRHDDRASAPADRFWWASDQGEVSQYIHTYQSRWLPARLCHEDPERVADALFEATRHWHVSLHFNKALFGASPEAIARDRATAINPAVFEAAALVMSASIEQNVFPGIPGYEPDLDRAARRAAEVTAAMAPIRTVASGSGSYVNETDYFEGDWQHAFWGANYERLQEAKQQYDPTNLFRVHHAVEAS